MNLREKIINDIKKKREKSKLSQANFVEALNKKINTGPIVTLQNIQKYEMGRNVPPADKYLKIMMFR